MTAESAISVPDFTYYGLAAGGDNITIEQISGTNGITMEISGGAGTAEFADPTTLLAVVLSGNGNTVTVDSVDAGIITLQLDGGTGTGNTLVGPAAGTEFTTDGAGDGTLFALIKYTYTGFTILNGGSGGAGELVGPADQTDPTAWSVTGPGAGTLGTVTFSNFAALVGSSGVDTLTGPNSTTTWTVTGSGTGTVAGLSFSGFDTITGGNSGTQTLEGPSGGGAQFTITGNDGGTIDGISFSGFQALTGLGSANTLFEPCPGTAATPSGACDAISYSGMQTVTSQPPSTYTFDAPSGTNTITVAADPGHTGYMEIVDNSTTTTFADPTGALVILGKGYDATITVDTLDADFNASLEVYGTTPLNLGIKASTSATTDYSQSSAESESLFASEAITLTIAGNIDLGAGNLLAAVNAFTVDSGVSIITTGIVDVLAEDIQTTPETIVLVSNRNASISIGGATSKATAASITAADISLIAYTWDGGSLSQQLRTTNADLKSVGTALTLLNKIFGTLPISVVTKSGTTSVTIGTYAQLDATNGSIDIQSQASVASNGAPASSFFSVGYGQAVATATVDVQANAALSATGAVEVLANGNAVAGMTASTSREFGASPPDKTNTAASIAITYADVVATATLEAGATILAGTDTNFNANGTVNSNASASSGNSNSGTVGIAVSLEFSNANVTTTVDGSITANFGAGSNLAVNFDPTDTTPNTLGYVDLTNYAIYIGPNSLQTGDAVAYSNNGGDSVGGPILGLINGTYYVIRLADAPDEIQLASTLAQALLGEQFDFGAVSPADVGQYTIYYQVPSLSLPTSAKQATTIVKTFAGSAISPSSNTITISLGRATGAGVAFNLYGTELSLAQPVLYEQGASISPIPGLVSGEIYYAVVPETQYDPNGTNAIASFSDSEVIELAATVAEAEAGETINLDCGAAAGDCAGTGYSLTALHTIGIATGGSGVGVTASLNATDNSSATASISDPKQDKNGQPSSPSKLSQIKGAVSGQATDMIFNALSWKLATYLKSSQSQTQTPTKSSVAVGGAFAFTDADHTVTETIAPTAVISSVAGMVLGAFINDSLQLSSSASIAGTDADAKKKTQASQHDTTISVGLTIAVVTNATLTAIGSGAQLNAGGGMYIDTETAYPLLTQLSGIPGSVGQLLGSLRQGTSGAVISTLKAFKPSGASVSGVAGGLEAGLISSFGNGFSSASAEASKLAIAASITFFFFTNSAVTTLGSGVEINQSPSVPATGTQVVTIESENLDQLVTGAGQVKTTSAPTGKSGQASGFGGAINALVLNNITQAIIAPDAHIAAVAGVNVESDEYELIIGLAQAGAQATSTAIGGTLTLLDQTSNTLAQIDTGAQITGGPLGISAESLETVIDGAGQVTQGQGTGIGISVALNIVNRTTQAVLGALTLTAPGDGGTDINVSGGVQIQSENDGAFYALAVAGTKVAKAASSSSSTSTKNPLSNSGASSAFGSSGSSSNSTQANTGIAIAGAAAVNIITDVTQAYINDLGTINPGSTGAVSVSASQETDIAGGAGAIAYDSGAGKKNNIAIAGALSLNVVNDTTQAMVIGAQIPSGQSLLVSALRTGKLDVGTVGAAGASGSGHAIGIAGSVSWQQITAVTDAVIEGVVATLSGDASLTATDTTSEIAIGGGVAYGGEVGIGASVGINEIDQTTDATLEPLTYTSGATTTTIDPSLTLDGSSAAGTPIYAQNATDGIDVIAVGISGGLGQSAVALTVAINSGTSSTAATASDATIDANGCTPAGGDCDVDITSVDNSTIDVGIGALALGVLQPSKNSSSSSSSSAKLAIGISVGVNQISQNVLATTADTTLETSGQVELEASATGTIYSVGVAGGGTLQGSSSGGGGGGGFQFAGAGVVMVNDINGEIEATSTGGSITSGAGEPITLSATDTTSIDADAGAAAILISLSKSSSAVAIGAAVAVNDVSRTIAAGTSPDGANAGTVLHSGGALDVSASSSSTITTWAMGIAGAVTSGNGGGVTFAGAGSGAGSTINNSISAIIDGGSVLAVGSLSVTATDNPEVNTQAGGVSFVLARGPPNAIAIGISAAANSVTDTVTAEVEGASSVQASTLSISATESASIAAWTIAGGGSVSQGSSGGVSFNGAGSGSGNTIDDTVLATITGVPTVTLTSEATAASVTAQDNSQIFAVAGSAAFGVRISSSGGANISVGAAVAVNTIDNSGDGDRRHRPHVHGTRRPDVERNRERPDSGDHDRRRRQRVRRLGRRRRVRRCRVRVGQHDHDRHRGDDHRQRRQRRRDNRRHRCRRRSDRVRHRLDRGDRRRAGAVGEGRRRRQRLGGRRPVGRRKLDRSDRPGRDLRLERRRQRRDRRDRGFAERGERLRSVLQLARDLRVRARRRRQRGRRLELQRHRRSRRRDLAQHDQRFDDGADQQRQLKPGSVDRSRRRAHGAGDRLPHDQRADGRRRGQRQRRVEHERGDQHPAVDRPEHDLGRAARRHQLRRGDRCGERVGDGHRQRRDQLQRQRSGRVGRGRRGRRGDRRRWRGRPERHHEHGQRRRAEQLARNQRRARRRRDDRHLQQQLDPGVRARGIGQRRGRRRGGLRRGDRDLGRAEPDRLGADRTRQHHLPEHRPAQRAEHGRHGHGRRWSARRPDVPVHRPRSDRLRAVGPAELRQHRVVDEPRHRSQLIDLHDRLADDVGAGRQHGHRGGRTRQGRCLRLWRRLQPADGSRRPLRAELRRSDRLGAGRNNRVRRPGAGLRAPAATSSSSAALSITAAETASIDATVLAASVAVSGGDTAESVSAPAAHSRRTRSRTTSAPTSTATPATASAPQAQRSPRPTPPASR